MCMRATGLLFAALLIAAQLSGCEMLEGAESSTYFVLTSYCSEQQPSNCGVYPTQRLDVTVSPSAQRVAWKATTPDGSEGSYTTGTHCAVIAFDDFRCDELALNHGSLDYEGAITDDHLISWILWATSSANRTTRISKNLFDLTSNTFASVAGPIGLVILIFSIWTSITEGSQQVQRRDVPTAKTHRD